MYIPTRKHVRPPDVDSWAALSCWYIANVFFFHRDVCFQLNLLSLVV